MRLGFLGPAGTFSEEAVRAATAGDGGAGELVPFPSIHETVMAVQAGTIDRALVPIENSLEGGVSATLDALALEAREVEIVGETVLAIRNCLIARQDIALDAIETVVSHPQPLGQCARFLRAELPRATVRATTSTADAVREIAASDAPWAALGPRSAAALYGCRVLRDGIDDEADNATRFVWLARAGTAPVAADGASAWKTSVVFAGAGDRSPGWLVRCLSEFAFRGVNLTRIESRPRKGRLGHYLFHVDMEGRAGDPSVADAIAALGGHCEEVRLLGSYPAA
ncbi:MAG: prephenate dehydratase [Solirubrobacteraceae bacterium]|jgi:prephenate dehydratase|nr:prephenate dehydratase [Solirubrobacteraceae bacterium]